MTNQMPARGSNMSSAAKHIAAKFVERKAFNKENAPGLLSQLLAVLKKNGLDDAEEALRRCNVPTIVQKAWDSRQGSTARLAQLRTLTAERSKLAVDVRKVSTAIFKGVEPFVRNYDNFIKELAEDMSFEWVSAWGFDDQWSVEKLTALKYDSDMRPTGRTTGDGWNEPIEHEGFEVEYPSVIGVTASITIPMRDWPMRMASHYSKHISNRPGFARALEDLTKNAQAVSMLGKVLAAGLGTIFKGDAEAFADSFRDDLIDFADGWSDEAISWEASAEGDVTKTWAQSSGQGLQIFIDCRLAGEPGAEFEPPEPEREPPEYYRAASKKAGRNPVMPKAAESMVKDLTKAAADLHKKFKAAGSSAQKILGDFEDAQRKAHLKWVAEGGRPDDFTDSRVNPEGQHWEDAYEVVEWLAKMTDARSQQSLTYSAEQATRELDDLMRKLK